MAAPYRSLSADQVKVGDTLPELTVPVTATTVVQGAAASRDWQPQHHDSAWARRVGVRDIFLNTPTQGGWICRYLTDWAGPAARIARLSYRMKVSICAGDEMRLCGTVTRIYSDASGCDWVDLVVEAKVGDVACTTVAATLALPAAPDAETPWQRAGDRWLVAELPPFEAVR